MLYLYNAIAHELGVVLHIKQPGLNEFAWKSFRCEYCAYACYLAPPLVYGGSMFINHRQSYSETVGCYLSTATSPATGKLLCAAMRSGLVSRAVEENTTTPLGELSGSTDHHADADDTSAQPPVSCTSHLRFHDGNHHTRQNTDRFLTCSEYGCCLRSFQVMQPLSLKWPSLHKSLCRLRCLTLCSTVPAAYPWYLAMPRPAPATTRSTLETWIWRCATWIS